MGQLREEVDAITLATTVSLTLFPWAKMEDGHGQLS